MSSAGRRRVLLLAPAFAALLAVLAVAWALFVDRERYDIRWKLRPRETLRYRTVQQMGSIGKESCHVSVSRYTVGTVAPDGNADVTLLQEQTTIREGGPDGPVTWDSGSGSPPPKELPIVWAWATTGVPLKMKVDARGTILSMEGLEAVKNRIREVLGGDLFGGFTDLPFSVRGGSFVGPPLPDGPVAQGRAWNREVGSGTPTWGSSAQVQVYTLRDVKKGVAVISLVERRTVKRTPGDVEKALKMDESPPDPNAGSGAEEVAEFSIAEGILLSQRDRSWTQGTLTSGKVVRFEGRSETTLIERRAP